MRLLLIREAFYNPAKLLTNTAKSRGIHSTRKDNILIFSNGNIKRFFNKRTFLRSSFCTVHICIISNMLAPRFWTHIFTNTITTQTYYLTLFHKFIEYSFFLK